MSGPQKQSQGDLLPVILRWKLAADRGFYEEAVEVIDSKTYEAVVRSAVRFLSDTEVDLVSRSYSERGVVSSCRAEGTRFIVNIRLDAEPRESERPSERDPGVFAVDQFLTEEDELRILEEVDAELAENPSPDDPASNEA